MVGKRPNRLSMLIFRPILSRWIPTAALVVMLPWASWAESPHSARIQAIEYQAGTLNVIASGEFPAPQVEVWEGNGGPDATEIIILSFPNTVVDLALLQQMSNQLLLQNPELKKFLLSPLSSDKKGPAGFQIALEIGMQAGTELFNPILSSGGGGNQWRIALKKDAGTVSFTNANLTSLNSQAAPISDFRTSSKAATKSDRKPTVQFPVSGGTYEGRMVQTSPMLPNEITQLKAALAESLKREESLQQQLTRYDDLIREYMPEAETGHSREKQEIVTIQNLRVSLVKLAQKLKITEKELEVQTQKNQKLTRELAGLRQELKHNANAADNPTLMMSLAAKTTSEETPAQSSKKPTKIATQATVYSAPSIQSLYSSEQTDLPVQTTPIKPEKIVAKPTVAVNLKPTTLPIAKPATSNASSKPVQNQNLAQTAAENRAAENRTNEKRLLSMIEANPKQIQAYLELSGLYTAWRDWSAAERTLTRLLRIYPACHPGYYELAWVYVHKKRKLEAQAALDTYRRLRPTDRSGIASLQGAVAQLSFPSPKT